MFKDILNKYSSKKFYSLLLNKNDLCFDIGANIGYKSKIFLSLGAKVIAFEPSEICAGYLGSITSKHFKFIPKGVAGVNSELEFIISNHIETSTFSEKFVSFYTNSSHFWVERKKIPVLNINDCIKEFGIPKFCKIDTEGYELEILSALNYNIPIIEFEFTEGFFQETLQIISKLGCNNAKFNFVLNENLKFVLSDWVSGQELISVLSNLTRKNLHGNIFVLNQL